MAKITLLPHHGLLPGGQNWIWIPYVEGSGASGAMFEFNLQTAVFFGTVALGTLLLVLGVLAFVGTTVMLGVARWALRTAEATQEKLRQNRSQIAG